MTQKEQSYERKYVTFEILSPLYMGGATQVAPEIRAPSIKGLMRYWYRAIDSHFKNWEAKLFGDAGERGISPFLLRAYGGAFGGEQERLQCCYLLQPPEKKGDLSSCEEFPQECVPATAGLRYLVFPFGMKGGKRAAFRPGQKMTVEIVFRPQKGQEMEKLKRAIAGSLWMISNIGGMGARCRRGLGSVRVAETDIDWPETEGLPLVMSTSDVDRWWEDFKTGIAKIREWFGTYSADYHATLKGAKALLVGDSNGTGFKSWNGALGAIGEEMKSFRAGRDHPFLYVIFGIPLVRSHASVVCKKREQGEERKYRRGASPLHFNVVKTDNGYYVLMFFTGAWPVPKDCTISHRVMRGRHRGYPRTRLDEFFEAVRSNTKFTVKQWGEGL